MTPSPHVQAPTFWDNALSTVWESVIIPPATLGHIETLDRGVVGPLLPHIPAHCHGKSCGLDGGSTVSAGIGWDSERITVVHGALAYVVEMHRVPGMKA